MIRINGFIKVNGLGLQSRELHGATHNHDASRHAADDVNVEYDGFLGTLTKRMKLSNIGQIYQINTELADNGLSDG